MDDYWVTVDHPPNNGTRSHTWLFRDRLGSIIAGQDAAGVVTPYVYGPYGEPQSWSGSRLCYTGQMAIPEAQLYHYRARAYDPVKGRFLQTDPIGYGDGMNVYAYVHGDPVNGTDPSGLSSGINDVGEVAVTASRTWTDFQFAYYNLVNPQYNELGSGPNNRIPLVTDA